MKEEVVTKKKEPGDLGLSPSCCMTLGMSCDSSEPPGSLPQTEVVRPGRWPLLCTRITWRILMDDLMMIGWDFPWVQHC